MGNGHLRWGAVFLMMLPFAGCAYYAPVEEQQAVVLLGALEQAVANGQARQAERLVPLLREALEREGTPITSGDTVTFIVFADPAAEAVSVMGGFSTETGHIDLPLERLGDTDAWITRHIVPSDAEFTYNIAINGTVSVDPLCQRFFQGFFTHSVARMPDFEPVVDRLIEVDVPRGTLENIVIQPTEFASSRTLQVYLPPGYAENRSQRYPVLYVNDGVEAVRDGRFHLVVDGLIGKGLIQPIILCFVPYDQRIDDYLFRTDIYARFLTGEVVPLIDGRYRTIAEPRNRGVTGASLGGRTSTWMAIYHSDLFGVCIAQSSYFIADSPVLQALSERFPESVRFYYDVGLFERDVFDRDLVTVNRGVRDLLRDRNADLVYREWAGAHNWNTWSRSIAEALPIFWPAK